jgi:hypothetical protein
MKKKFGDLTVRELDDICLANEDCDVCPLFHKGFNQCSIKILFQASQEKEIELPDDL